MTERYVLHELRRRAAVARPGQADLATSPGCPSCAALRASSPALHFCSDEHQRLWASTQSQPIVIPTPMALRAPNTWEVAG